MEIDELKQLISQVAQGSVNVDDAVNQLREAPFVDLGYAKPDTHRGVRTGVSEVIYGAGKTAEQIAGITQALLKAGQHHVFTTRIDPQKAAEVQNILTQGNTNNCACEYHQDARILIVGGKPQAHSGKGVVVCAAGTSDIYCAEEAALTAEMLGSRVTRLFDVGVAGLHRLLAHTTEIQQAAAVVAVAGMEGALASVVGGLASSPVIAVPTSVGYGASFGGLSALLSMLNSCASGVSVVNIDNGFGAGYQAALIDRMTVHEQ